MRITQKTLYDYGELLPEICQASKDENHEFLLLLIAAKTDIEQAYAGQCNNYSVLVTCYDERKARAPYPMPTCPTQNTVVLNTAQRVSETVKKSDIGNWIAS